MLCRGNGLSPISLWDILGTLFQFLTYLCMMARSHHWAFITLICISGWWFHIFFIFTPAPTYQGRWSNLTNIFQMDWNHQLVICILLLLQSLAGSRMVARPKRQRLSWKNSSCWTNKLPFDHGSHVLKHRWKRFPVVQDTFCINFASFCIILPTSAWIIMCQGFWGYSDPSFSVLGHLVDDIHKLRPSQENTAELANAVAKWHKLKQERQAKRTCTWSYYATMFFSPLSRYIYIYSINLNIMLQHDLICQGWFFHKQSFVDRNGPNRGFVGLPGRRLGNNVSWEVNLGTSAAGVLAIKNRTDGQLLKIGKICDSILTPISFLINLVLEFCKKTLQLKLPNWLHRSRHLGTCQFVTSYVVTKRREVRWFRKPRPGWGPFGPTGIIQWDPHFGGEWNNANVWWFWGISLIL